MIIYLVYNEDYKDLLIEEGCNIILTFANLKCSDDVPKGFNHILIDSGGFQAQTGTAGARGKKFGMRVSPEITPQFYAGWLHFALPEHPEIDAYFNLDVLGNTDQTIKNQTYLEGRGFHPIPVWHPGEDEWVLDYYCSIYDYVAIGGLVGAAGKKLRLTSARMRFMFERIFNKYPNTKFHAFGTGIGSSTMFRTVRPYSIDFSTWLNSQRYGSYLDWDKDGLLREYDLPQDEKTAIRGNAAVRRKWARHNVQRINEFKDRLEKFTDTTQSQMDLEVP